MDVDTLLKLVEGGATPALGVIAWLLWKMDKALTKFIAELRGQQTARDNKLDEMHNDIGAMIRKMAGFNGSN